jgi:hypothetical protein
MRFRLHAGRVEPAEIAPPSEALVEQLSDLPEQEALVTWLSAHSVGDDAAA